MDAVVHLRNQDESAEKFTNYLITFHYCLSLKFVIKYIKHYAECDADIFENLGMVPLRSNAHTTCRFSSVKLDNEIPSAHYKSESHTMQPSRLPSIYGGALEPFGHCPRKVKQVIVEVCVR